MSWGAECECRWAPADQPSSHWWCPSTLPWWLTRCDRLRSARLSSGWRRPPAPDPPSPSPVQTLWTYPSEAEGDRDGDRGEVLTKSKLLMFCMKGGVAFRFKAALDNMQIGRPYGINRKLFFDLNTKKSNIIWWFYLVFFYHFLFCLIFHVL